MARIEWEIICHDGTRRLEVFGGWLVQVNNGGMCFVPDPEHLWLK